VSPSSPTSEPQQHPPRLGVPAGPGAHEKAFNRRVPAFHDSNEDTGTDALRGQGAARMSRDIGRSTTEVPLGRPYEGRNRRGDSAIRQVKGLRPALRPPRQLRSRASPFASRTAAAAANLRTRKARRVGQPLPREVPTAPPTKALTANHLHSGAVRAALRAYRDTHFPPVVVTRSLHCGASASTAARTSTRSVGATGTSSAIWSCAPALGPWSEPWRASSASSARRESPPDPDLPAQALEHLNFEASKGTMRCRTLTAARLPRADDVSNGRADSVLSIMRVTTRLHYAP
jgi:hypothetical protein